MDTETATRPPVPVADSPVSVAGAVGLAVVVTVVVTVGTHST